MTISTSDAGSSGKWWWRIALLVLIIAVIVWFAPSLGTKKEAASSGEPVVRSTDWAPEPTGPKVPVNLPKTRMTNVPEKAP
jgi:hypothetical protein